MKISIMPEKGFEAELDGLPLSFPPISSIVSPPTMAMAPFQHVDQGYRSTGWKDAHDSHYVGPYPWNLELMEKTRSLIWKTVFSVSSNH